MPNYLQRIYDSGARTTSSIKPPRIIAGPTPVPAIALWTGVPVQSAVVIGDTGISFPKPETIEPRPVPNVEPARRETQETPLTALPLSDIQGKLDVRTPASSMLPLAVEVTRIQAPRGLRDALPGAGTASVADGLCTPRADSPGFTKFPASQPSLLETTKPMIQAGATLQPLSKTELGVAHPAESADAPQQEKSSERSPSAEGASSRAEKTVTPGKGRNALRRTGLEERQRESQDRERRMAVAPVLHNPKATFEPAGPAAILSGGPGTRQNQISISRIEVQVNNQVHPAKSVAAVPQTGERRCPVDVQFLNRFSLKS